ncbi:MAG TPA: hypothetical protein VIF82_13900 [Burkholderiaceae bacterium]|jgi:hypothetical protein
MRSLNLSGKFLSTANGRSWIDTARIAFFDIEFKKSDCEEFKKMELDVPNDVKSLWVVTCNCQGIESTVGIFRTEDEARSNTEKFLVNLSANEFFDESDEKFESFLQTAFDKKP